MPKTTQLACSEDFLTDAEARTSEAEVKRAVSSDVRLSSVEAPGKPTSVFLCEALAGNNQ